MSQLDLIGTPAAAQILGKSHRTIHRLVKSGALKPAVVATAGQHGTFLFNRADIEAFKAEAAA